MIRTITMPRRLGALEMSQGCVEYQDPNTGQWIADANTPCLPADPGAAEAVSEWSDSYTAAANASALNELGIPFFGGTSSGSLIPSAPSLTASNGIASPIPGLGLGPQLSSWWIWAAIAGGVLLLLPNSSSSSGRRRS